MITQTGSKAVSYLDLKSQDRLKFFKGNKLECIMEVDNILSGEIVGYVRNDRGTYKFKTLPRHYRPLFSGAGIYNFGKGHGKRVHCRIELSRFYEWRRE